MTFNEEEYQYRCHEIDEAEWAERWEFELGLAGKGFGVCKFDGEPCHTAVEPRLVGKIFPCYSFGRDWTGRHVVTYVCSRIRLKGGKGYGMSIREKLRRQELLPK